MAENFRLVSLPTNPEHRKRLYKAVRPTFIKRFGRKDGPLAFKHGQVVAEEVARYTAKSRDKHWAGVSIILASLHPLDSRTQLPSPVLRNLSDEAAAMLKKSFLNLNTLRSQDEAPPEAKDPKIYRALLQPCQSRSGLIVLPPEAFVRVIDMSEFQFYSGRDARELHKMTSHGRFPQVVKNMAHSVLRYWRPAAIQLLLFSCYDKQSNIAAFYLYPDVFRKMTALFSSLKDEFERVGKRFSDSISSLVECAEKKGIPIVKKTDRDTGKRVAFITRRKTAGSATIKAIQNKIVHEDAKDFDPDIILAKTHDLLASTLVAMRQCDAEALYCLVSSKYEHAILEREPLFYGGCRDESARSHSDYKGVGHIDLAAAYFGAERMHRLELHVRSFESDHDYYHGNAGRGFRDSPELADAWGDLNLKIVRALGLSR